MDKPVKSRKRTTRPAAGSAGVSPAFADYDGWIFLALALYRPGPATLPKMIAAADCINHAIPMAEELDGALNRFLAAGYVAKRKGGYGLTSKGAVLYRKASTPPKGRKTITLWDRRQNLQRLFACPCCGVRLKSAPRRVTISDDEVHEAYLEYVGPKNRRR